MMTILAATAEFGSRFIGEIVLLTVAAVFVGFGTYKIVPAGMNPKLFGVLVPFLVLGVLAYLGSLAAATSVVIFVLVAIATMAMGLS